MNPPPTIKQLKIVVDLGDSQVVVRRMYWKAAKDFFKLLAKHVTGLGVTDQAAILAKLPEVIASADELATFLIVNSSDLKPDEVDKLDLAQMALLLQVALEANTGDELKNSLAGIAAALAAVMPATKTKPGAESTPA